MPNQILFLVPALLLCACLKAEAAPQPTHPSSLAVDGQGAIELRAGTGVLHLQTVALGRNAPASFAEDVTTQADGRLEIRREEALEHLSSGEGGVEQSWRFERSPQGSGRLRVEVAVWGAQYLGETNEGLRFAGFRYGHPTWIDADGGAHALTPARWEAGRIVLEVPPDVLEGFRCPCVLDPLIAPEMEIVEPVYVPSGEGGLAPSVATNGSDFMVAWPQDENLAPGRYGRYVVATRVSASGQVLDVPGIHFPFQEPFKHWSAVASDGQQYFVIWGERSRVVGRRVRSDGTVIDGSPIEVTMAIDSEERADIASNGAGFLVVFNERYRNDGISAVRVAADGTVLDALPFPISAPYIDWPKPPTVASDGSGYLVTWTEKRLLRAARVDASGTVLDPGGFPVSGTSMIESGARAAFGGGVWLLVWLGDRDLVARRMAPDGTLLGTEVRLAQETGLPTVAFDGTEFVVGYQLGQPSDKNSEVHLVRVATDGTVMDSVPPKLSGGSHPSLASAGGQTLVAWADASMKAARVRADLSVDDSPALEIDQVAVLQSAIAAGVRGNQFLAGWSDQSLRVARIDLSSGVLDKSGIAVGPPATGLSIASDGTDWLLAFSQKSTAVGVYEDVWGARVSGTGQVLQQPFRIGPSSARGATPSVAWTGKCFLVAWYEDIEPSETYFLYSPRLARVGSDGQRWDPVGVAFAGTNASTIYPRPISFAASGTEVLAAVNDDDAWQSTIVLYRFGLDGQLAWPTKLVLSGKSGRYPAIATDGTNFLVAYVAFDGGVLARHVGPNLTQLDSQAIELPTGAVPGPIELSYDGRTYLVTWRDELGFVRLVRIRRDGSLVDLASLLVDSDRQESDPALASNISGQTMVVQTEYLEAKSYSVRATVRFVTALANQPNGAECADGSECGSGFCSAGVCCDRACDGPCEACRAVGGAPDDGKCRVLEKGRLCRAAAGACDIAEVCDGTSAACPKNAFAAKGTPCAEPDGPCDLADSCNGTDMGCPDDVVVAGKECRASAGPCDAPEQCDGYRHECPYDRHYEWGHVCRPAAGPCDAPERCDDCNNCPPDEFLPAGTPCRARRSEECDLAEVCAGNASDCPADQTITDGTSCEDGDLCTTGDSCSAGLCGAPVECVSTDECRVAACEASSGHCVLRPGENGIACSQGVCWEGACLPNPYEKPKRGCGCGAGGEPTLAVIAALLAALRRSRTTGSRRR